MPPLQRILSVRNPNAFWSRIVAVSVFLFPLSLQHLDFRATFLSGLSVSAHKASPAYAAFQDLHEDYDSTGLTFPENAQQLMSGSPFDFDRAIQSQPTVRQITLAGMNIRSPPPRPIYVAGEVARAPVAVALPPRAKLQDMGRDQLPLNERRAQLLAELEGENWKVPSVATAVQELLGKHVQTSPTPATRIVQNPGAVIRRVEAPTLAGASLPTGVVLAGQVELTLGLAAVGPETPITVKRVYNGKKFEEGRLWVTEGRFEIRVSEPVGHLVAELKTLNGTVLGQGEYSLVNLAKSRPQTKQINGLRIELRPTAEVATLFATGDKSYGDHRVAHTSARVEIEAHSDPQKVNEEGIVRDHSLNRESSFVARATAKDHWPSIVVGQAQVPHEIRVFSNKMIGALIDLNLSGIERREAHQLGIVWGKVTRKGKVVAGAQVQLAGGLKPIYFNEIYLPDSKLTATGANGMFAFVRVPPGVQALRVNADKSWIPAQIFASENKHVSFVDVEIREKVATQLRIFDGFEVAKPVSASVRLVGDEASLAVNQEDMVELSVAGNPYLLEAEAKGDYLVSRVTVVGAPHTVYLPLFTRAWVNGFLVAKDVSQRPDRGIVIGLVDELVNGVELTGYARDEKMQIFYFDAQGNPRQNKIEAGVGGGFFIANAPNGLQTLFIHSDREIFSQTVVAEPEVLQVVTH